jgi:hypothetical protein
VLSSKLTLHEFLEPTKRNIFSCLASMQMLACRFVLHIHLYIHVHMYKCTYVHMYICTCISRK